MAAILTDLATTAFLNVRDYLHLENMGERQLASALHVWDRCVLAAEAVRGAEDGASFRRLNAFPALPRAVLRRQMSTLKQSLDNMANILDGMNAVIASSRGLLAGARSAVAECECSAQLSAPGSAHCPVPVGDLLNAVTTVVSVLSLDFAMKRSLWGSLCAGTIRAPEPGLATGDIKTWKHSSMHGKAKEYNDLNEIMEDAGGACAETWRGVATILLCSSRGDSEGAGRARMETMVDGWCSLRDTSSWGKLGIDEGRPVGASNEAAAVSTWESIPLLYERMTGKGWEG